MTTMQSVSFVYDAKQVNSFQVTATRYMPAKECDDGVTLILAHATSAHKETWEPLLTALFLFLQDNPNGPQVKDAWSIECPNHGESAVINEHKIAEKYPDHTWDGYEYPRAMLAFLNSKPAGVDFYQRELVALGHSHGGNSLVLLHDIQPRLQFTGFVLLDPTLGWESPAKKSMRRILAQLTWLKRDTWLSREQAFSDLSGSPGFRNWDPAVLKLFIAKGIRSHPASVFADPDCFNGVSLACTRSHESACHRANDHHARAWKVLHELYGYGEPVHLILSKTDEFGGTQLKLDQIAPDAETGGRPSSVQWIEKGGHMFVQTMPIPTAQAVWNALSDLKSAHFSSQPLRGTDIVKTRL